MGDVNTGTIGYLQVVRNAIEDKSLNSSTNEDESVNFSEELKDSLLSSITLNNQKSSNDNNQTPLQSFEQENNIQATLTKALFSKEN